MESLLVFTGRFTSGELSVGVTILVPSVGLIVQFQLRLATGIFPVVLEGVKVNGPQALSGMVYCTSGLRSRVNTPIVSCTHPLTEIVRKRNEYVLSAVLWLSGSETVGVCKVESFSVTTTELSTAHRDCAGNLLSEVLVVVRVIKGQAVGCDKAKRDNGRGNTRTVSKIESRQPVPPAVTTSLMKYTESMRFEAFVYVWVGLAVLVVFPLPKNHCEEVPTELLLVKLIESGVHPESVLMTKAATGLGIVRNLISKVSARQL